MALHRARTTLLLAVREAHLVGRCGWPAAAGYRRRCRSSSSSSSSDGELVPPAAAISTEELEALRDFVIAHPRILVITGAGLSTESGIPDYRSPNGSYSKGHKPITWQQFSRSLFQRQRYWSRSMAGWEFMARRRPNPAHHAVAELQSLGRVSLLVTQNVDRLHHDAATGPAASCVELHGTIWEVECTDCGNITSRDEMQRRLHALNPQWREAHLRSAAASSSGSNRPDGDVELADFPYEQMELPACKPCGGMLKPGVVLFGENVPAPRVADVMEALEQQSDAVLLLGTSCQVYSAFRFIKAAAAAQKPVCVVNVGATRADPLATLIISARVGETLPRLVAALRSGGYDSSGSLGVGSI